MTKGTEVLIRVSDVTDPAWSALGDLFDSLQDDLDLYELRDLILQARRSLVRIDKQAVDYAKSHRLTD